MHTYCVVFKCNKQGTINFPKDPKLKLQWIKKINRKDWKPSPRSRLCVNHFKSSDFLKPGEVGYYSDRKKLRNGTIPSIFQYLTDQMHSKSTAAQKHRNDLQEKLSALKTFPEESTIPSSNFECPLVEICSEVENSPESDQLPLTREVGTQTDESYLRDGNAKFRYGELKNNKNMLHFYTGLQNASIFLLIYNSLRLENLEFKYGLKDIGKISKIDQFFMTIMRLRRYRPMADLAYLFGTSETLSANITTSWIHFMYKEWSRIDIWPSKQLVNMYMPRDFKLKFPSTRVILDCFEFPVQKPSDPANQRATFSSYKNRNTAKVLLGITPGGQVSYISPAYGGAASDRQLVEKSGLVDKCERGDSVMADKGFKIQDLFACKGVTVNTPTFLTGKNKLSGLTVRRDRSVSSKRIHVERVIGLGKTFKILVNPLTRAESFYASEIAYVCFFLCNFRNCVVGKNA